MLDYPVCPRCLGYIPNNVQPGEYIGALSRICDKQICSECGTEEAMVALIAEDQWPIVLYDHKFTQDARERWYTRMRIEDVDYAQKS